MKNYNIKLSSRFKEGENVFTFGQAIRLIAPIVIVTFDFNAFSSLVEVITLVHMFLFLNL